MNTQEIETTTMTADQILAFAQRDYAEFISNIKSGKISEDAVSEAILSIYPEFGNLDVEVRHGAVDYLWMGFTLRGENDFAKVIQRIAEFAEGMIKEGALRLPSPEASSNMFEFEVEVGHVMEPETITETFTFRYSDSLRYWSAMEKEDLISMNSEIDESAFDFVEEFYEKFNQINDKFDYLNEQE